MKTEIGSHPTDWIHDLARGETHPDTDRLLGTDRSSDPHLLIEEATIVFLRELRESFAEYTKLFNSYSENSARFQEVKIYSVAQTPADFMLFRNQVKLVISNNAHGVVSLSLGQNSKPSGASISDLEVPQEIIANLGAFRNLYWTYQGERVNPDSVAKYYFAEFVRNTRDHRNTKASNKVLLDQIRSLLEEKGLDLS